MERLIGGRRVEVRAKSAHWSRLIPGRRYARFQVGNFRGQQLLFMIAAVETVSRLTLLELAEPELRTFLLTVSGRVRAKNTTTSVLKSTFVDSL